MASNSGVFESHKAKAPATLGDRISNDLAISDFTVLCKVLPKPLIGKLVVQAPYEDLVAN